MPLSAWKQPATAHTAVDPQALAARINALVSIAENFEKQMLKLAEFIDELDARIEKQESLLMQLIRALKNATP